jgi:hypothetical protein
MIFEILKFWIDFGKFFGVLKFHIFEDMNFKKM